MKQIPPFYVGQEVVALVDHFQGAFKKGDKFRVDGIFYGCCEWLVTIGIISHSPYNNCSKCNRDLPDGHNWIFAATRFAPIISDMQAITYEKIREQEPVSVN